MVKKIGVLLGGLSEERTISLKTGEAIYQALKGKGYDAVKIDVDRNVSSSLIEANVDLAFLALHGKYGEDGTIQGLLEFMGIPYTGSGVLASALAINKIMTKRVLKGQGIPTSDFLTLKRVEFKQEDYENIIKNIIIRLGLPLVVKAPTQGSSIGISFVHNLEELIPAMMDSFKYDEEILLEKFIKGTEITSSVLGNDDLRVLPLIEITSKSGVYDFEAKYTVGLSDHLIPPRIPAGVQAMVQEIALQCYKAIGCKGLARIDFMVDEAMDPYVIEINTIPGMTETSLFPDAAKADGISFADLVQTIVQLALEK